MTNQPSNLQYVDLNLTKEKFDLELKNFKTMELTNRKRGIILLESNFPDICLAFLVTKLTPSPIAFAVKIDFTNYDIEAPSVVFIDPFTFEPIKSAQSLVPFWIKNGTDNNGNPLLQNLIQQEIHADALPFICIPGVREYHNHPAHSGDSWLLHRKLSGEGTLGYLVEKLYEYGLNPIGGYHLTITQNYHSQSMSLLVNPNLT